MRVPARTILLVEPWNQVGVATARGAAVATDVISQYAVRNRGKGKVIFENDYRNAFNCVDRLSMLRAEIPSVAEGDEGDSRGITYLDKGGGGGAEVQAGLPI